jgi:hypothetical protein
MTVGVRTIFLLRRPMSRTVTVPVLGIPPIFAVTRTKAYTATSPCQMSTRQEQQLALRMLPLLPVLLPLPPPPPPLLLLPLR